MLGQNFAFLAYGNHRDLDNFEKKSGTSHSEISVSCTTEEIMQ